MDSFVSIVKSDTYNDFIARKSENYKIILFTQKKSTPPLYRALSKDFKDKIIFGEVRASD